MNPYLAAALCVLGTATGQLLFKAAAHLFSAASKVTWQGAAVLVGALVLYAASTLLWIWVLTRVDLSRVYPLMALSFILVPVGNTLIYRTPLAPQAVAGALVVLAGTVISVWNPK